MENQVTKNDNTGDNTVSLTLAIPQKATVAKAGDLLKDKDLATNETLQHVATACPDTKICRMSIMDKANESTIKSDICFLFLSGIIGRKPQNLLKFYCIPYCI